MTKLRISAALAALMLLGAVSGVAVGQGRATGREVVAKVREAARTLSKTGDVAPFNQKQGSWVWKDTYIFVMVCDKNLIAGSPMTRDLVGTDFGMLQDTKWKNVFADGRADAE